MDVREKLVELLADLDCNAECCKDCEFAKDIDGCVRKQKEIIADHLIAHGVTVQEWISVKDRLPENMDDRVLVLLPTKSYDYPIGNQHIDTDRYRGEYRKWVRYGDKVTHWMSLPQPPKGE